MPAGGNSLSVSWMAALAVVASCSSGACADTAAGTVTTTTTDTILQYNVTIRFASAVTAGRYATGDWWVVGPATVASVDPPASADGRNGWQLNPSDPTRQALDARIAGYNASLMPALPQNLSAGDALVKAVSLPAGSVDHSVALRVAVVVTVVSAPPAADAFRPPYFGTRENRAAFSVPRGASSLLVGLLPNVTAAAGAPDDGWIPERFGKPQIDWLRDWVSREIHPTAAMPDYGSDILRDAGDAALKLLTATASPKGPMAAAYVQWGIDSFGVLLGGGSWPANGGHDNGRKIVMVYAALLLGDEKMAAAVRGATPCTGEGCTFSEDGELARQPAHANLTLFGSDPGNGTWDASWDKTYWSLVTDSRCDGDRIVADPYGYIDGGYSPGDSYQFCCTSSPWKGTALPLLLWPAARGVFNDEGFVSYVRRWMAFGAWAQPDPCAPPTGRCSDGSNATCTGNCTGTTPCGRNGRCVLSMGGYGKEFGPDGEGGCIVDKDPRDGVGRFPARHGVGKGGGDYGSAFQSAMWAMHAPPSEPPAWGA